MLEVIGAIAARLQPRPSGDMRWLRRVLMRLRRIVIICLTRLALVAQVQCAGYAARSGAGG